MESLKDHFLLAMPSLQDTFFERAVIYICEHDKNGAMGLVINHPYDIKVHELLNQLEINIDEADNTANLSKAVVVGGPVDPERGFVLHSPQPYWKNSVKLNQDLMLTSSRDILVALGTKKAPTRYLVALGYAGWGGLQLEDELANNSWLTIKADNDIIFSTAFEDRWQIATEKLGFDIWQLSSQTGHA